MIAKIGKGSNMYGAILYNQQKVDNENGAVLLLNKIPDTVDGHYSISYFNKCFEPYFSANIKTEKMVRHISLNPDPSDKVNDEQFTEMAQEYMSVWVMAINPISFSNIRILIARIFISFRPALVLTARKSPMITTIHAQWLFVGI